MSYFFNIRLAADLFSQHRGVLVKVAGEDRNGLKAVFVAAETSGSGNLHRGLTFISEGSRFGRFRAFISTFDALFKKHLQDDEFNVLWVLATVWWLTDRVAKGEEDLLLELPDGSAVRFHIFRAKRKGQPRFWVYSLEEIPAGEVLANRLEKLHGFDPRNPPAQAPAWTPVWARKA